MQQQYSHHDGLLGLRWLVMAQGLFISLFGPCMLSSFSFFHFILVMLYLLRISTAVAFSNLLLSLVTLVWSSSSATLLAPFLSLLPLQICLLSFHQFSLFNHLILSICFVQLFIFHFSQISCLSLLISVSNLAMFS